MSTYDELIARANSRALVAYESKHSAFLAAKAAYSCCKASYEQVHAAYREMLRADEHARYIGADFDGPGHWAPTSWDKDLPLKLRIAARDIGRKLRERLEAEWSEKYKCKLLYGDWDSYLTGKEQHRILVLAYMCSLPKDDPDLVAYRLLRYRKTLRDFNMPLPPGLPGLGRSRTARRRRYAKLF